jgi:endonuclease/exonuclease/phosphatase family metal-dependent hydrolase
MESLVRPRRLDIVGLTEVKRWYNEQLTADGYDYHAFHERMEAGDDFLKSRRGGCGFFVKTCLRERTAALEDHSTPNMGWMRVRSTKPSEQDRFYCVFYGVDRIRYPEKADRLLHELAAKIAYFKPRGEVVVLGDFNAHVGLDLGPNALPKKDESGRVLCDIASDNELIALNTGAFCSGTSLVSKGRSEA